MLRSMPKSVRAAIALLLMSVCGVVAAQDTTRLLVQVTRLKPDRVDEWREIQEKEVVPALKRAGVATRYTLETMFGDRPEFITVRPLASFAEFDGEGLLAGVLDDDDVADLTARLAACTESTQRYIVNRQNEFTVGDVNAPVRVTVTYRPNRGGADAYRDYVREQLLPLNQKAVADGLIAGYTVGITGQGSPEPGLWIHTTYRANLASLDAPGIAGQVLGEGAAANLGARGGALRETVRVVARRRVPELSY